MPAADIIILLACLPVQERHRAFAALMRTLFEKVDHDVRCEVVSCI